MKDPANLRIYSTRAGESELEERIQRFVVELAERIDSLQDAQLAGDLETLAKQSLDLRREALDLGYPPLADKARELAEACAQQDPHEVLDRLVDLTEIGRRVRLGHPGAF